MTKDIKEEAKNKIWSKYFGLLHESLDSNIYWKMDLDRQKELRERDLFELEVWSYILELIEKDNKL